MSGDFQALICTLIVLKVRASRDETRFKAPDYLNSEFLKDMRNVQISQNIIYYLIN